jgi:hypothetical protein
MTYRSRRSQESGIGRGGAAALLVAVLVIGAAFWVGPLRPLPAELRLVALADGAYTDTLEARAVPPDSVAASAGAVARAPLVLGVRNVGARATRPESLRLSVPGRFRLTGSAGEALPFRRTPGTPLVQYTFELSAPAVPARGDTLPLAELDTLWLEPLLPEFDCALLGDSVPDFMPAPEYDPSTLATVPIFYDFDDGSPHVRQTGLLTVRLDPELLRTRAASAPTRGRLDMHENDAPRPDLGPLTQVGTRTASCGDPESPVELRTVVWEGETGGRMYEVQVGNTPRLLLYDTNRDGVVELELSDGIGDGVFRARRDARYAVPSFLRPLPTRLAVIDEPVAVDSVWLAQFNDAGAGPFRFARAETAPVDPGFDAGADIAADPAAAVPPPQPVDSAWLARFHDAAAGPFRFSARPTAPATGVPAAAAAEPAPAAADTAPAPPPRRQPPRLLGTPVPWPPDTTTS